jgi:hypothetical protein
MNIGIHLKQMPVSHPWWTEPSGVEYDNKTYWMAECTSLAEWRVGDQPQILTSAKPHIIPLTNCEKNSPAQVSSSLDSPMQPSAISINLAAVHSNASNGARILNVSGSISPALPNQQVVFYVNNPGYAPTAFKILTDAFGNYSKSWNATHSGKYVMKTSWSGSFNHSGSDSETINVFIGTQQPVIEGSSDEVVGSQVIYVSWSLDSPLVIALINQGSKEFLKRDVNGHQFVLSGDFMVLSDGCEIAPEDTTFTIPAHSREYRVRGINQKFTVMVPEKEVTIPGAELLNSHFGFILQQKEENNYTASVKTLNEDDLSQINQEIAEGRAAFINASNVAGRETWCKAIVKVSGDEVAVEVYDENQTQLDKMSWSMSRQDLSELGVLMAYQTGQIIAFKNLNVEFLNRSDPPITQEVDQGNVFEFLYPYLIASLLLAGTILVLVSLWQSRKSNKNHLQQAHGGIES